VISRDNISKAEVEKREARQMPEAEKIKLADDVIVNDDVQLVIPQVMALHQQYLAMANTP
jgi:dephospho-CoA kinase